MAKRITMTTEDAWVIVYDLAKQNALEVRYNDPDGLKEEARRQKVALDIVHDFIVNNMEE